MEMRTTLSFAVFGLVFSVCGNAQAEESAWFDGNVGGIAVGGDWAVPQPEQVRLEDRRYVLNNPSVPLEFGLDEKKSPSTYTNLVLRSTLLFGDCSEIPEVPAGSKFSVTAYAEKGTSPTYRVYVKDSASVSAANRWVDTKIPAVINRNVSLVLTVNGTGAADATAEFSFDGVTYGPVPVLTGAVSGLACAGTGTLSDLVGRCAENWIPPSGKTIPRDARASVDAWAKANGVRVYEFAETTLDKQGRTKYESCLLNLAPDAPLVATADRSHAEPLSLGVAVSPPLAGAGEEVSYVLSKGDGPLLSNATGSFEVALGEGRQVFSIQASVGGKAVGEPAKIGSQKVAVAAGGSYLPVPWTDSLRGDIRVTDLVKRSSLASGDQIDVYDAARGVWTSCVYDGAEWEAANGAEIPVIARGLAFRFTPKSAAEGSLYLIGNADAADVTATPVVPNAFTLVAKPDGTAFALEKLSAADKVLEMEKTTGLPTATYVNFHGAWVRKQTGGAAENVAEIEPNRGFFVNTSSSKINW